jgi:hypothetical protein
MELLPMLKSVALSVSSLLSAIFQKRLCSQKTRQITFEAKTFAERALGKPTYSSVLVFCGFDTGSINEIGTSFLDATDEGT